jgi:tetratricopeptide (TPR) repeat protein
VQVGPELLAHHCIEGGLPDGAVRYLHQAGQLAIERSANTEAIAHLTKALEVVANLPDTPERDRQELKLRVALGAQIAVTKGYAAPAAQGAFGRAREICQELGEEPEFFPALFGLWRYYLARAQYRVAKELAEQCLALAKHTGDPALLIEARHALAWTLFALGELPSARTYLEQALALYDPCKHSALAFVYGTDPGSHSLSLLSWLFWLLGRPEQALKTSNESLALARQLNQPVSLAVCQMYAAVLRQFRREPEEAQVAAEAAIVICRDHGIGYYLAMVTMVRGWALAAQGRGEEAAMEIREGLAAYNISGAEVLRPFWLALAAETYEELGRLEEAMLLLGEAQAAVDKTEDRWYEPEICRLQGQLLLARGGAEYDVEECFNSAIRLAGERKTNSLKLRAATSFSQLRTAQGKWREAYCLLCPILGEFTEGADTNDLQSARALLEQLQ